MAGQNTEHTGVIDAGTVPDRDMAGTRPKRLTGDALAAALMADTLAASGVSQEQLARRLGVSRALVRKWLAGEAGPSRWCVRMAERMPRTYRELLRRLVALEQPTAARLGLLQSVANVHTECADVVAVVHRAVLDGSVDESERRAMLREIAQAIAALEAMRREVG